MQPPDTENRHKLLDGLLIAYKVCLERGEQESIQSGTQTFQREIKPEVIAILVSSSALIANVQSLGISMLKELIALRLMTQGRIEDLENEASRIIKPYS